MTEDTSLQEILAAWPASEEGLKPLFGALVESMNARPGLRLEIVSREHVSHSVRAMLENPSAGRGQPLLALLDVVTPKAGAWMISLCFFAQDITDPDELGDEVPGGLYGEDGYCFDLDTESGELGYLAARLDEAYAAAGI